jgi:hypothetical protein
MDMDMDTDRDTVRDKDRDRDRDMDGNRDTEKDISVVYQPLGNNFWIWISQGIWDIIQK